MLVKFKFAVLKLLQLKFSYNLLYQVGLIICSYLIGKVFYGTYYSDNIFAVFIYAGIGITWLLCFYNIFKKESTKTTVKFKLVKYLGSILSLFTLLPILLIYLNYQKKFNVPTLLKAQRHGVYADFKNDGTYIIKSGPWASKKHFYGKYILQNNIIQIDTNNLDIVLTSNRFLIKNTKLEEEKFKPDYDRLETKNYLVQIDITGNEIIAGKVSNKTLPNKFEVDNRR